MAEISDTLLLHAVSSDPERMKLFEQFHAERAEIDAAQEKLRVDTEDANRILTDAQTEHRLAQNELTVVIERERKVSAATAALTGVIKTYEEGRARWEALRKRVDADHAGRDAALAEAEERHLAITAAQQEKEIAQAAREISLNVREAKHARRAAAIKQALEVV